MWWCGHFVGVADGLLGAPAEALGEISMGWAARMAFWSFLGLSVLLRSSDLPLRKTVGVPVTFRVCSA